MSAPQASNAAAGTRSKLRRERSSAFDASEEARAWSVAGTSVAKASLSHVLGDAPDVPSASGMKPPGARSRSSCIWRNARRGETRGMALGAGGGECVRAFRVATVA